jgi:soluble calcium-activated nucleotidase 1
MVAKGFKAEWMTVKSMWLGGAVCVRLLVDEHLYVGGLGKEWTTTEGEFVNHNPMYVKRIDRLGHIEHLHWIDVYKRVRAAAGIEYPGYMIHEAVRWSGVCACTRAHPLTCTDRTHRWLFLPRRASQSTYSEADDEHRGTNYAISVSEDLHDCKVSRVTPLTNTRGFSAFQFVPGA